MPCGCLGRAVGRDHRETDDGVAADRCDDQGTRANGRHDETMTGPWIRERQNPGGEVSRSSSPGVTRRIVGDPPDGEGARGSADLAPRSSSSADHQPRSSASRSSVGTTSRRATSTVCADRASARSCSASTGSPAFGSSRKVAGSGAWPNRAASVAHRSRHADGVASGASRWAPASQTSDQDRGTTR